jgi:hypothetical protein
VARLPQKVASKVLFMLNMLSNSEMQQLYLNDHAQYLGWLTGTLQLWNRDREYAERS